MKKLVEDFFEKASPVNITLFVVGVIGFLFALGFHYFSEIGIKWHIIVIISLITLLTTSLLAFVVNYYYDRLRHKKVEELASAFLSEKAKNSFWFHNNTSLTNFEKGFGKEDSLKEIWIVSNCLKFESNSRFVSAIQQNLKDGISYYYFVPLIKKEVLDDSIDHLYKYVIEKSTKGKIVVIGVNGIDSIFYLTDYIAIYNPELKSDGEKSAYVRIRLDENKLIEGGWIEIDRNQDEFKEFFTILKKAKRNGNNR